MRKAHTTERMNTIVIGGGQAGLSVGYHLARHGVPFAILDASARVGDAWRNRWDSLRLFSPRRFSGLDGLPFPGDPHSFPTKNEMADFLEAYAKTFSLPVRSGVRVDRLSRLGDGFVAVAGDQRFEADHIVVAMSSLQQPRRPPFARQLDPRILQMHSFEYRNPSQLRPGAVLLVGVGNSGAEIAIELSRTHRTILAGRPSGEIPFRIDGAAARLGAARLMFRVLFHRVLTIATPLGRRVRPHVLHHAAPLIRQKEKDLLAAGVERVGRVVGVRDGRPLLEDGNAVDAANVIWCTGFHPAFSWIDLPVFDENGDPRHHGGVVADAPGLYFVGLHFLYAFSSEMIHGVGRDAARIAKTIARRPSTVARPAVSDAARVA